MGMRNYLIFGGVNSANYGIYITGSGVYDAPERVVERVAVPGRNGALVIDQDRYENISVEYPAFAFGKSRKEFQDKIDAFRNAIASQIGYKRLEDSYHPEEYRMATYAEGLKVDVGPYGGSGRFTLKFNCKPQRFLRDGEHSVAKANGEKIINPTEHSSEPLLVVNGYGDIGIGDYDIRIDDVLIGQINVSDRITVQNQNLVRSWNINEAQYNPGDHVTISGMTLKTVFTITNSASFFDYEPEGERTMGIEFWSTSERDATLSYSKSGKTANFGVVVPAIELTIGQNLTKRYQIRSTINVQNNTNWQSQRLYDTYLFKYENGTLSVSIDRMYFNQGGALSIANPRETCTIELGTITGDSTVSILDDTIYIDCEIGEVYSIREGELVPLNSTVSLGSDLPKLKPGENEITFSETIEGLKITPRWWQI